MDLILKLVAILLSIGMLGIAYAVSRAGSWLMPASLFCVAWFLFTFIPLVSLLTIPINPVAIAYILAGCLAFSLPALLSRFDKRTVETSPAASQLFDTAFLRTAFFGFTFLSIAALMVHTIAQGVTLAALLSDFYGVSNSLIADRYSDRTVTSIYGQIANVASYIAVALGGLIFPGFSQIWKKIAVLVIAMIPSIFVLSIFGAKGMVFLCISMFYAGYLVRRMRTGDHRLIDRRSLLRLMTGGLALIPFVTVSFIARGLYAGSGVNVSLFDGLVRSYVSYTSGHIYAFADWFSWYVGAEAEQFYAPEEVTGGFYTFMTLFRLLGSERIVPPGVFVEYFQHGAYLQSNIYTLFRGLIVDFTLPGSLLFLFLLGLISHQAFLKMSRSMHASFTITYYISLAGFIYTSFIISLLIWYSLYGLFAGLSATLFVNSLLFRLRHAASGQPHLPAIVNARS